MSCFESGIVVDLTPQENLVLTDVRGAVLRVNRGTLWITQENDTRDVVLRPGDTWMVERQGDTIIEAQSAATICASGSGIERALAAGLRTATTATGGTARRALPRLLARLRHGLAAWWSLTPRQLPYF